MLVGKITVKRKMGSGVIGEIGVALDYRAAVFFRAERSPVSVPYETVGVVEIHPGVKLELDELAYIGGEEYAAGKTLVLPLIVVVLLPSGHALVREEIGIALKQGEASAAEGLRAGRRIGLAHNEGGVHPESEHAVGLVLKEGP